jgi:magnesium transporter
VLSHRLNDTFRILTAISVIVLPLTLIASIWGMNSKVPGEATSEGFWVVVGIMVVVLVATIALFRRRGWL